MIDCAQARPSLIGPAFDSMAAYAESVLSWPAAIVGVLQRILDEPEADHGAIQHVLLCTAHVMGIIDLTETAKWKTFKGRHERRCARYTFLYHVTDGGSRKLLPPVHVDSEGARAATSYLTKEATEWGQLRRENSRNPSHPTRPLVPSPLVMAPAALQSSPLTLTQVLGRREAGPMVRSSIPPALIPLPPRSYPLRPALLTPHLPPH